MCFLIYMVYVHVILSLHRLPLFFYLIWRQLVEMQIVARHMCVTTWSYDDCFGLVFFDRPVSVLGGSWVGCWAACLLSREACGSDERSSWFLAKNKELNGRLTTHNILNQTPNVT